MPRRARIQFVSLRSSLVNLPISIYGPLVEHQVRPQKLAVHLSRIQEGKNGSLHAYVGWTGMISSSSLARFSEATSISGSNLETIEIDPQFATDLGFHSDDIVEVGLLHDLPVATTVSTEPWTSDDWEILELHASYVEQNLLSQVRVVQVGQEVDIWVLGRTRVRLRIVSIGPLSSGQTAALLTNETEVSVSPKARSKLPDNKIKSTAIEDTNENTNISSKATKKVYTAINRVVPSKYFALRFSFSFNENVAWVSPSTFCHLFQSANEQPIVSNLQGYVTYDRLIPPLEPTTTQASTNQTDVQPEPKILHGALHSAKNGNNSDSSSQKENSLLLICSTNIPPLHIVVHGTSLDIQDWDLINLISTNTVPIQNKTSDDTTLSIPDERPSYHDLVGCTELLAKITEYCAVVFLYYRLKQVPVGMCGLLLLGRQGTGKTSLARAAAKFAENHRQEYAYCIYVDASKYVSERVSHMKSLFQYWYQKAYWFRPCVLILDNLDKLLSAEEEHEDSFRQRHLTRLFLSHFHSRSLDYRGILVIATAESESTLHGALLTSAIFKETITIRPPTREARRDMLEHLVRSRIDGSSHIIQDPQDPLNYMALAMVTDGYSVSDLKELVGRSIRQAYTRHSKGKNSELSEDSPMTLTFDDFQNAQLDYTPIALRNISLQTSDVSWADIGGLNKTRQVLRETLEWPTKYAALFAKSPLRMRSGLLLYGYPGCGKTLLASAVAKECGLNFISVKGPELLNKYIGASEKSVRDLFDRATAAKPCVLFFDEFDSIAPKRGHDSTGVTDRVVNQMLTQMDGAEGLDGVYVLAATSRPDLIDPALLRPGRLDKSLLCDMPNIDERREILQVVSRKVELSPLVDLDKYARITDGLSGADLQALIYNAHLDAIHSDVPQKNLNETQDIEPIPYVVISETEGEDIKSRAEDLSMQRRLQAILSSRNSTKADEENALIATPTKHIITDDHLMHSLKSMRPSVSQEERSKLSRIYNEFISQRGGGLPVPTESTAVGSRVSLM